MASVSVPREETSSEFEERFSAMASSACAALAVALGSRLGLFHKMALMEEPWTPQELAEAGNWKKRYIVEWLGAVVCAGIVEVVPSAEGDRYFLPLHRRELLRGPIPIFYETLPLITGVHEDIVTCFSQKGPSGVPYSKYPHLHEWSDTWMNATKQYDYIRHFNESTPGLIEKLEKGGRFLGIGCSTGVVECVYATNYSNSTFVGVDLSEHAIHQAKTKSKIQGLGNVEFCVYDVHNMPDDWTETFDGVIGFDVLHDFSHPEKAAKELQRVLKFGGILSIMDIFAHSRIADNTTLPTATLLYTESLYLCMPVSLHAGGIGAGAMWGRVNVINCLQAAGFVEVIEPEEESAHYVCVKK